MRARVYVSLKKSVLDPQGKTIHHSLQNIGFQQITEVRQGKYFEIDFASELTREEVQTEVEKIARDVLTNPVIEEFSYRIE
ncbi:MAG: phosphoribosylformylglycinamidine synthase subunit PurS [Acidobacteria bacterium]|nr:phosphoribosylformylglycinamidine synthase subunit PurS [Acidobacteriota bacterium]